VSVPARDILRAERVSKTFGTTGVLTDVTFALAPGRVHALVGENGAGKSTLMNILSGGLRPDGGELVFNGRPLALHGPRDAMSRGIAIVHQELSLFPERTVAQNIFSGREPVNALGFVRRKRLLDDASEMLHRVGTSIDPHQRVGSLSVAAQQLVEIAKALSQNAKVLILDEPTSALPAPDGERLLMLTGELKARGVAIVWISHNIPEVLRVADEISVLRDGRLVGFFSRDEATPDRLVSSMVGGPLEAAAARSPRKPQGALLSVEGLSRRGTFTDVSFELGAGEILGFAGLVGSGRTEVARSIFGADRAHAGRVMLGGKTLDARSPRDAIAAGLAYVPEDRKAHGLFLELSTERNVGAAALKRFVTRTMLIRPRRLRHETTRLLEHLDVRPADPERSVRTFSGGNQQKVLLARWLAAGPRVLIADEPTRGVDVSAKARIHRHLRDLAEQGLGIVLISSDLAELLALSDRIAVFKRGRIAAVLEAPAAQDEVMRYAAI
jgi:ABC-type sugar transport system ATPase subunit